MDFCDYQEEVDGVTCFSPFVKPETLVYWRLPLNLHKPMDLFIHISRILKQNGFFFMVNHGFEEGQIALEMLRTLDMRYIGQFEYETPVFERTNIPVISLWMKTRTRLQALSPHPRNNHLCRERRKRAVTG